VLVDAESCDASEQQFEDSLITSPLAEYRSIQLGPERNQHAAEHEGSQPEVHPRAMTEPVSEGIARHDAQERALDTQAKDWRDEIFSRLNNYARRRGRKRLAGEFSMQLDFDRPRRSSAATAPALDSMIEPEPVQQAAPNVAYDPEPDWNPSAGYAETIEEQTIPEHVNHEQVEPPPIEENEKPRPRRHHRIIEFPRLFAIEQTESPSDELAETLDHPRILDVPEETEQIFLPLGDISMEMQQQPEEAAAPAREFELPIQVASMSQRVFASLTDGVIVLFATAIFAGIALNIMKEAPQNKLMLIAGLVIPCFIWAMYHYLFLVHAAKTPGMKMAQLRLATFTGQRTTRRIRRVRALSLMLSLASAGMGFGWALVDEDTLCWHDRISRTYLTNR
jgi:uncharacterized RDD family membrane protein YckC